jgi:hypothetical protein
VRLSLETTGGLAAALRLGRPPTVVDSAALPASAADELAGLVAAARDDVPPPPDGSAADEASYTITVEDGGAPTVLRRTDTTMTAAFAELLDWVQRHGSPQGL